MCFNRLVGLSVKKAGCFFSIDELWVLLGRHFKLVVKDECIMSVMCSKKNKKVDLYCLYLLLAFGPKETSSA